MIKTMAKFKTNSACNYAYAQRVAFFTGKTAQI
jgi:hypothetical protein